MFKKLLLTATFLLFSQSAFAAVDMFIKIGDIKGESQGAQHEDEIDVLAWSWGASTSGRNTCLQDISLTKWVDLASPVLLMNQVDGVIYPEATLVVRKAGETQFEFIKLVFKNVSVSSLSTGGSGGEDRLTENVTLNFESVTYTYTVEADDHSAGTVKTATIRPSGNCK